VSPKKPLRAKLASSVSRSAAALSRATGRGDGSVIGGKIGLLIDPNLLANLAAGRDIALVSGTNGKTTTTRLATAALGVRGEVATNSYGANMPTGHTSALARAGDTPYAVLEVDEHYLPQVLTATKPRVIALLNLSRDQLDRAKEVAMIAQLWRDTLAKHPVHVVANADDPMVAWAAQASLDAGVGVTWVAAGQRWHDDSWVCPNCGSHIERADGSQPTLLDADFAPVPPGPDEVGTTSHPAALAPGEPAAASTAASPALGDIAAPAPVDATMTQLAPARDAGTHPTPVDSGATHPTPVEGRMAQPTPVEGALTHPTPIEGAMTRPTPIDAATDRAVYTAPPGAIPTTASLTGADRPQQTGAADDWWCTGCTLRRPVPDWRVDGDAVIDPSGRRHPVELALPGRVNRANAATALAVASRFGVDPADAVPALASVASIAGRYAQVDRDGRRIRLLLAKNPAGWLEAFDMAEPAPTLLSINSRDPDGLDTSWLFDVDFSPLHGRHVYITGDRAFDLAVRLEVNDIAFTHMRSFADAVAAVPPGRLEVIANYTAFQDIRAELDRVN
jgi:UDP-N-acetylmuramyl tripeptide synthase